MMNNWQFAIRIYPCAAWSFVLMCLMFLFVARYYQAIEPEGQRLVVLKRMLQTEVKVAAALAPAFRAVSSLAFAARAGILNTTSPYASLAHILEPEFRAAPALTFVQVVGVGDHSTLLRRGNISEDARVSHWDRQLLVLAARSLCGKTQKNPVLCFKLNNSGFIDVPRDASAVRWQRPSFLTYNGTVPYWVFPHHRIHETIDATNLTIFAHRLVAYINASNATSPSGERGPILGVEIGIDLGPVFDAVRGSAPDGGATYVLTTDGTVIAGSDWIPEASTMYDPEEAMVNYPTLWDLGLSWTNEVTPAMVAGARQHEGWSGSDIVVTRPLAVGDMAGSSYRVGLADLRIVSTGPRTVGTSSDFKALIHGAMGVMGAPGIFFFVFSLVWGSNVLLGAVLEWMHNRH